MKDVAQFLDAAQGDDRDSDGFLMRKGEVQIYTGDGKGKIDGGPSASACARWATATACASCSS